MALSLDDQGVGSLHLAGEINVFRVQLCPSTY